MPLFLFIEGEPLYTVTMLIQRLTLTLLILISADSLFAKGSTGEEFTKAVIEGLIGPVIGLASTGLLAYYIFAIAKYMWDKDQSEIDRLALRRHLMWGAFGLFLVFSVGGIYALISTFAPNVSM